MCFRKHLCCINAGNELKQLFSGENAFPVLTKNKMYILFSAKCIRSADVRFYLTVNFDGFSLMFCPLLFMKRPFPRFAVLIRCVCFFLQGCWRKVIIDDAIPFDDDNHMLLPATTLHHELWPMLLSKALIKVASLE